MQRSGSGADALRMTRRRVQDLAEVLLGFVDRDEGGALVLACEDSEIAVPIHLLADLARRSPQDRFVVVAEVVAAAGDAVAAIAAAAGKEDVAVDEAPARRLGRIVDALLEDLPEGDGRLVLALVPTSLAPSVDLEELFAGLFVASPRRLRLVVRDRRRPVGPLFAAAEAWPGTAVLAMEPGLAADELRELQLSASGDARLEPRERRAALLQVGWTELGAGRLEAAAAIFAGLVEAHAVAGEPGSEAYAWMGLAEARRRSGDVEASRRAEAAALARAAEGGDLLTVAHLALKLAGGAAAAGDAATAERGYGLAEALAADLRCVAIHLDAACGRARLLAAAGRLGEAREAYRDAEAVARAAGDARAEEIAGESAALAGGRSTRGPREDRSGAGGERLGGVMSSGEASRWSADGPLPGMTGDRRGV